MGLEIRRLTLLAKVPLFRVANSGWAYLWPQGQKLFAHDRPKATSGDRLAFR